MPPPLDYRDMPELWQAGDFKMDEQALRAKLPSRCSLQLGQLQQTIPEFMASLAEDAPIGFVSIDVDYYSSTVEALRIFEFDAENYLPIVCTYLDDIIVDSISDWSGELLAINEFNLRTPMRKISPFPFLRPKRLFQRARWIDQIFLCHIHDLDCVNQEQSRLKLAQSTMSSLHRICFRLVFVKERARRSPSSLRGCALQEARH